jgi:hypothetical protein
MTYIQPLRAICAMLLFLGGAPSIANDLTEYECAVLPRGGAKPAVPPFIISVAPLSAPDPVRFPSEATPDTHMVTCARSMLVPTVNDAKVLTAGYTMSVGSGGEGDEPRVAFYFGEIPNVEFVVANGRQTKAEKRITTRVLKEINRQ